MAFESDSALVKGDHNDEQDIFVRDIDARRTSRVSIRSNGTEGDDQSSAPAISATGRYVAFDSQASTLVPHDTLGHRDVFIHDRRTGKTRRLSVAGDTLGFDDVFVHDRKTGKTRRVSIGPGGTEAAGDSSDPAISADGRRVAFASQAANLIAGDTKGFEDVFVRDRVAGTTRRVSVRSNGAEGDNNSSRPDLSEDGRFVAFASNATNLVKADTNSERDAFWRGPL